MSDTIRCPMCGKPNPADADVCRYCHARLRPLLPDDEPRPTDTSELESALPAWMHDLRAGTEGELLDLSQDDEEIALNLDEEKPPAAPAPATDEASALWEAEEEEEDLPDWLKSLGDDTLLGAASDASSQPEDDASEDQPLLAEDDLPDWLRADASEAESDALSAAETEEDNALPDWLQETGEAGRSEPALATEDDLPDWMAEPADMPITADAVSSDDANQGALPDWMTESVDTPITEEDALPQSTGQSSLPDWLKVEEESFETAIPAAEERLPDWLAEPENTEGEELPAIETSLSIDDEALSEAETVLTTFQQGEGSADDLTEDAEARAAAAIEALDTMGEEALAGVEMPPPPFVEIDLPEDLLSETPDWLNLLAPEPEESAVQVDEEPTPALLTSVDPSVDIALGELPSWLEAMRPVAATSTGLADEDVPVETTGPLAGLRGVLSLPKSALARPVNLTAISGRLVVTEQQKRQVEALEALLAEEFAPLPKDKKVKEKKSAARLGVLRWLVGLLLLLAALVPFVVPPLRAPLPHSILPAALDAHQHVSHVQAGQPVLVGVDYSPGFAGEMESAAIPVLDDLLTRGASLVLVSTQPTGPGMAMHLISRIPQVANSDATQRIFNLGYLPGGTAGLYAFAHAPRQILADAPGRQAIWQSPALDTVHHLTDFAMVVVITEDAATARAWLEQVRPVLDTNTPMIMVISAQAEPLVQPYYETNPPRVSGIVTGIEGGITYAAMDGKSSPAGDTGQWSSYSNIVLMAVLLMILTGLYNLVRGWKEARTRNEIPDDDDPNNEEVS